MIGTAFPTMYQLRWAERITCWAADGEWGNLSSWSKLLLHMQQTLLRCCEAGGALVACNVPACACNAARRTYQRKRMRRQCATTCSATWPAALALPLGSAFWARRYATRPRHHSISCSLCCRKG